MILSKKKRSAGSKKMISCYYVRHCSKCLILLLISFLSQIRFIVFLCLTVSERAGLLSHHGRENDGFAAV